MGMSIGELFVSLGFDVDDGKLKSFNDSIKSASGEILKLSAIATAGLYSLNAFVEGSINRAFGLKNFVTETGQAEEGLLRFQSAVNQVNASISTSEAATKYRALANAITDISQQGGGGSLARLTGGAFQVGMKEEDVIEAIRNYKQTFINENGGGQVGQAAHARLLDQIGVGAGSERVFDLSPEQYNSMTQSYVEAEMRAEGANVALGAAIAKADQEWTKFKDNLVADWSSPLIHGLQTASDWIKEFMESVRAIIDEWRQWPDGIKETSAILLGVLALWAAPLGGTLAILSGIALAIWDIGKAIRGLPSFSGSFLDTEKRGLSLLFNDPGKFGNNVTNTILTQLGYDPDKYLVNKFPEKGGGGGVTQTNTNHIYSNQKASDLFDEVERRHQQSLNSTLMSLAGRPSH